MRIATLATICILLIAGSVSAQMNSRWQFGVKGGVSVSTHDETGNWVGNPDFRAGIDVGAFVSWRFSFSTELMIEAHYVQNGHDGPKDWNPESSEFPLALPDFRIDYISVPVLLRIDMPVGELPTYLLAGPHFNFKVGENELVTQYYSDQLKSFAFGGTVGFGHQWQIGAKMAMFGEVQYHHDFTEAFNLNGTKLHNRAFSVLIGLKID